MAAAPKFDELALRYVLAVDDEKEQHRVISEQAAQGELLLSVRWAELLG
jgi:hypothetical protein